MSAQLDLVLPFRRECVVPAEDTQQGQILRYLRAGGSLTVAEALSMFGCYALSQRCGELSRAGWPIISEMVKLANGKRVARYRMADAA